MSMTFDYPKCRSVLYESLIAALTEHCERIRKLNADDKFWAISYDVIPWDPYLGVAFRLESEFAETSLNSADWKHSHFIEDMSTPALHPARDFVFQRYQAATGEPSQCQEIAHLIFLAAGDALLDESVALLLQSVGVMAPVIGDKLPWNYFKYVVLDEDGVIKANYCDIICANRVTRRLLGAGV
jgi:hypothetical protein